MIGYLSRGRKMAVLRRQAGRVNTASRTDPPGGESVAARPPLPRGVIACRLLPSSSDLLCRGAGPDCRAGLLQSEGERWWVDFVLLSSPPLLILDPPVFRIVLQFH